MNIVKRLLLAAFVLCAVGCATREQDEEQARTYRMGLAGHLGIPMEQIRVQPGRGVTHVTIYGIQSEEDRQRIATDLATLNKNNPKMNPLKWTFELSPSTPIGPATPVE